jgi:hypothetical protein
LGWLQLLVAKQIIPEIYLTQLPTGHTHEDIDALFGHIWIAYRNKPCLTLSDYAKVVRECFSGNSKIAVSLVDVYMVPNYEEFLAPHNDPIRRWAKEELTVHQIHIYAVKPSFVSPLGYRLRYRIIELKAVPKSEAFTIIGQMTGIETVTHHVKWFPDGDSDLGNVESGIFTLRRIPITDPNTGIIPEDFDKKHMDQLETTRSSILNCKFFPVGSQQRDEWINWFNNSLPIHGNLSGKAYAESHIYHQPLHEYLSNKKSVRSKC